MNSMVLSKLGISKSMLTSANTSLEGLMTNISMLENPTAYCVCDIYFSNHAICLDCIFSQRCNFVASFDF